MASALSSSAVLAPQVAAKSFNTRRRNTTARRVRAAASSPSVVRVNAAAADVETYDTVVIGAGVSGLTTAFTLGRDKPDVKMLVTEARDYVGGNIQSKSKASEGPHPVRAYAALTRHVNTRVHAPLNSSVVSSLSTTVCKVQKPRSHD